MSRHHRIQRAALAALVAAATLTGCSKEESAPVYQLVAVTKQDIIVSASAAGAIEPVKTVDVKSKASGELMEVRVEVGDQVQAGQLLVKVDPRTPRLALRQAEADLEVAKAQLANAQSQLRRAEGLFRTQSMTEQEYETANLQAANAQAQLVRADRSVEDARIAFEDTDVKAPINGIIIQKNVEVGTVISSAMREVGGGTVLLQMANLDTVQIRALVDETDIGKLRPGLPVTITVEAYPNRPFRGEVLKIEPQATVQQNVTMFPVLVRIANEGLLLKPGMNAEVELHIGEQRGVLAVPNAALRTERDVSSAAFVLGLDQKAVDEQIAQARQLASEQAGGQASMGGTTATNAGATKRETMNFMGREIELPEGVTAKQVQAIFQKMRDGGGPDALSPAERAVMQKLRGAGGRGPGGGMRGGQSQNQFQFGGNYIVFVKRNGTPTAVPIKTGLTDLDYSEVVSGLTEADTVYILPSASLVTSQQEMQQRMSRMGGGVPGMQRTPAGGGPR